MAQWIGTTDHRRRGDHPLPRGRGRDRRVRPARRGDPARSTTRWAHCEHAIRHYLVRHEQGAGHMAQGYARATGKVGVAIATSGPGRDQPRDPDRRRLPRLDADRVHHRPGADAPDRHRRLPGGRHPGHHHADRQALLARQATSTTSRASSRRRSTSPAPAGPARCWSTSPRTSQLATFDFALSEAGRHPRLQAVQARPPAPGDHGRRGDPRRRAAGASTSAAAPSSANVDPADLIRVAEAVQMPVVTTLMAKGVFPDSHPLCIGLPGMHGSKAANWAMNQADLLIACGSRFDDRVTGKLDAFAPGAQGDPHGRRPGRDRQEPRTPRSRSSGRSSWSSPSWPRRSSSRDERRPAEGGEWLDTVRGWKREYPFRYRNTRAAQARVRDRAAARPDRRPRRDLDDRRRPAPDVGRAVPPDRPAAALADLGRPRHDGLRRPGRDRRQGRPPRRDRDQHRRRRLLPDDDAGAGDRRACTASARSTSSSTTAGWGWCASGRSCSTTSASPRPT